ncbi:MAG: hypothetical protein U5N86_07900 [Planctomycetota bacterium]|nr:hypothetical protein [Planctomycetota bacterium]
MVYSLAFPQDEPLRGDALTRVFVTYRVFPDTPKMQIYDKNLVPLFDDKYSDVELAPEGDIKYFLVCKNDSYGILDRSGSKVVGFKHEQGKVFGDKIVIGQPNEWFVFDAISGDINGPFDYYVIVPTFGVYKDDPRKYCFLREPHDKDKTDEKGFLDPGLASLQRFSVARSTLFPGGLYATYVIAEGAHHRTWTFYDINKRKGLSVIGVLKVVPSANAEFPETFPHKKDKYARRHFIDLAKRPKFLAWVKDTDEGGYVFIDSSADAALRVEADKVKYLGLDYFDVRTGNNKRRARQTSPGNEISR